ncbi:BTB/POZ domain-containing protein KCTD6-like [Amphiura filiformis]|uniref:BTB/POZ domain-containing protein KCTD6-like n=1 Tax=Amphiura filiformis TaxID=82378 RepID=UPI003B20CADF
MSDEIVQLNIGGHVYTSSRFTLTRFPKSMLGTMFSDQKSLTQDKDGQYWIDGNGEMFCYVLDFLRRGCLMLPEHFEDFDLLEKEADFYKIPELIRAIRRKKGKESGSQLNNDIVSGEYIAVEYYMPSHFPEQKVHISGPRIWIEKLCEQFHAYSRLDKDGNKVQIHYTFSDAHFVISPYNQYHLPQTVLMQEIMNMGFRVHNTMPDYQELDYNNVKQWFIKDKESSQHNAGLPAIKDKERS